MSRFSLIIFILTVLISVLLISCNNKGIYDEQINVEDAKWLKGESARFPVEISDSAAIYDFYINVRNTTDYRYSNLYVFLLTRFPNGNLSRDTIEFQLADKTGKWIGKGWGSLKENKILLKRGLRFPLKGEYLFLIQQAMRVDTLDGIENVGIRIEKIE